MGSLPYYVTKAIWVAPRAKDTAGLWIIFFKSTLSNISNLCLSMNNKYSQQNLQILKTRLLFSLFRLYIFNILRMFPFIVNYEFILYIYKAAFRQSVSHALLAD